MISVVCAVGSFSAKAQDIDGGSVNEDTKWYEHITFGGYIQAQWHQTNHTDSTEHFSYSGGHFERFVSNKFTVRRGRIRMGYEKNLVRAAISFDVNETGFHAKDAWFSATDKWLESFMVTGGVFARPFGREIEISSRFRESPERSRLIQTLFPGIRDLGFMLSYQQPEGSKLDWLRADFAVFQGNSAHLDIDNAKDFVGRLSINNPLDSDKFNFRLGGSAYFGKIRHQYDIDGNTANYHYVYEMTDNITFIDPTDTNWVQNQVGFDQDLSQPELDSILNDTINPATPATYSRMVNRTYFGAHAEARWNYKVGNMESYTLFRGEFITGVQPSQEGSLKNIYKFSSHSPTGPSTGVTWPKYDTPQPYNPASVGPEVKPSHTIIRNFVGYYAYLIQQIGKHRLIFKFDYYDPNTEVAGIDIDANTYYADGSTTPLPSVLSVADVAFTTFGFGYQYNFNDHLSVLAFYELVRNEETNIPPLGSANINFGYWPHTGYMDQIDDDMFTLRLQYIF